MPAFRGLSIRNKLMVMFMASSSLTLVLACAAFITYDQRAFRISKERDVTTLAQIIGSNSVGALTYQDASSATGVLSALSSKWQVVEAYIYDKQGRVFARYVRDAGGPEQRLSPANCADGIYYVAGEMVLFRGILLNGEVIGTVSIHDDLSEGRARLRRYLAMLAAVGLGSLLVAFALISRLQRSISSPIVALAQVTRSVSIENDYSKRAAKQYDDETGELIDGFNNMLDQIQIRDKTLQEATDAARSASRAKSDFLANMSHEIRTPLNGVIGMTDLALGTDLSTEQRDYLEIAKISADSLLGVISDILDFSKIESGKVDLEAIPFNLRDWLDATLKTLALRADEKELEILCEVSPGVPQFFKGDSARLRQVLVNLAGNAIKFTSAGEVAVKVTAEPGEGNVRTLNFVVSDTGVGIPKEKLKMIFDPFSQADSSTTREFGGTGLGLSISSRLVEMMGGRIWVESEPGQGSQFHFTVSLELADAQEVKAWTATSMDLLRGVRVLVVDDNRTNRRILDAMLRRWEMNPVGMDGGDTALAELSRAVQNGEPYNLILTDMHMPKMDGFALVEQIRQRAELDTVTIMMLTSGGHKEDQARCRALGLAAYLWKPIAEYQLRDTLVRVLSDSTDELHRGVLPSEAGETAPARYLRVLVAEDNKVNQLVAERLLQKRGHVVVVAKNGTEALHAWREGGFDLLLMDVQMPEMGGIEATAVIREHERKTGQHVPIVALTANAMKGDREKYLASGMDGYLAKPIHQIELDKILDRYTRSARLQTTLPDPKS